MDIGGCDCCPLVAIQKRMVLDETLEQCSGLGNGIFVITRLGSENGCLQRTKIPNTVRTTELVNEDGVNCEHVDNAKVFAQLLSQLFVEPTMPGD